MKCPFILSLCKALYNHRKINLHMVEVNRDDSTISVGFLITTFCSLLMLTPEVELKHQIIHNEILRCGRLW